MLNKFYQMNYFVTRHNFMFWQKSHFWTFGGSNAGPIGSIVKKMDQNTSFFLLVFFMAVILMQVVHSLTTNILVQQPEDMFKIIGCFSSK